MHLTEKQCGLLSEFMYLQQSVIMDKEDTIGTVIRDLKDKTTGQFNMDLLNPTGGITKDEAVEFLKEIEKDPMLRNLRAEHTIDTGIRATCFVDSKARDSKDAIVVFRGTGGITRAWEDNIVGAYEPVTAMQQEAVDFVRDTCKDCMISQVTGHSKGGNLAMHVTIASGRIINECIAFDGQGFNNAYMKEKKDLIEKNAPRIKCINADKDFVSPLLNPIVYPGNTKWIKIGDVKSFPDNHKLTSLVKNEFFDWKGQYLSNVIGERAAFPDGINVLVSGMEQKGWLNDTNLVDNVAVGLGALMTNESERKEAMQVGAMKREKVEIQSGVFHVVKDKKEEEKDRLKAEKRDLKRIEKSKSKTALDKISKKPLTAAQIDAIKGEPTFLDKNKVKVNKDELEYLKNGAIEACELSESVLEAHNIIESAKKEAETIISEANSKASGVDEAVAKAVLKNVRKELPQHFHNGIYVGNEAKKKEDVKYIPNRELINSLTSAFEKTSKNLMSVEQIKSIEGNRAFLDSGSVIIPKADYESIKQGARVTFDLLRNDIKPKDMVESVRKEADRIVKDAKNMASGIKERSAQTQLQNVQKDMPQLFRNGKFVGRQEKDKQHAKGLKRDTDRSGRD